MITLVHVTVKTVPHIFTIKEGRTVVAIFRLNLPPLDKMLGVKRFSNFKAKILKFVFPNGSLW